MDVDCYFSDKKQKSLYNKLNIIKVDWVFGIGIN